MLRRRQERERLPCMGWASDWGCLLGPSSLLPQGLSVVVADVPCAVREAGGAVFGVPKAAAVVWGGCPRQVGWYLQGFAGRLAAAGKTCCWGKQSCISGDIMHPYGFRVPSACAGEAIQPSLPLHGVVASGARTDVFKNHRIMG